MKVICKFLFSLIVFFCTDSLIASTKDQKSYSNAKAEPAKAMAAATLSTATAAAGTHVATAIADQASLVSQARIGALFIKAVAKIIDGSLDLKTFCKTEQITPPEYQALIDHEDALGWTLLFHATNNGRLVLVQKLIRDCSDTNHVAKNGTPLITFAVSKGIFEIIREIAENGAAHINIVDSNRISPLLQAIWMNEPKIMRFLLVDCHASVFLLPLCLSEHAAQFYNQTLSNTPYDASLGEAEIKRRKELAQNNSNEIIALLKEREVREAKKMRDEIAQQKNLTVAEMFETILKANRVDKNLACVYVRFYQSLLMPDKFMVLLNFQDAYGWTLLFHAISSENIDLINLLISFKANCNHVSKNGDRFLAQVPMCIAVFLMNVESALRIIKILKPHVDLNIKIPRSVPPPTNTAATQNAAADPSLPIYYNVTILTDAIHRNEPAIVSEVLEGDTFNLFDESLSYLEQAKKTLSMITYKQPDSEQKNKAIIAQISLYYEKHKEKLNAQLLHSKMAQLEEQKVRAVKRAEIEARVKAELAKRKQQAKEQEETAAPAATASSARPALAANTKNEASNTEPAHKKEKPSKKKRAEIRLAKQKAANIAKRENDRKDTPQPVELSAEQLKEERKKFLLQKLILKPINKSYKQWRSFVAQTKQKELEDAARAIQKEIDDAARAAKAIEDEIALANAQARAQRAKDRAAKKSNRNGQSAANWKKYKTANAAAATASMPSSAAKPVRPAKEKENEERAALRELTKIIAQKVAEKEKDEIEGMDIDTVQKMREKNQRLNALFIAFMNNGMNKQNENRKKKAFLAIKAIMHFNQENRQLKKAEEESFDDLANEIERFRSSDFDPSTDNATAKK